ncbi:MAG: hypothetical protein LUM44_07720 [Pyrinomonadaceae bacterium]|nr:hypothetical protein [Pyrinomonadaceae bacterium]
MAPKAKRINIMPEWMKEGIIWACNRVNYTIDRDNMNDRQISEKVDDLIMGDIGGIVVLHYLQNAGIAAMAYDQVRNDGFKNADPGWDIVIGEKLTDWFSAQEDKRKIPNRSLTLSIKTSRIPETFVTKNKPEEEKVQSCIMNFDFKIFRKHKDIEDDITTDYEVQIYYPLSSSYTSDLIVDQKEVETLNADSIMEKLKIFERYGYCYLASIGSRSNLIGFNKGQPENKRTWDSFHAGSSKPMWRAPLWLGTSIESFIEKHKK